MGVKIQVKRFNCIDCGNLVWENGTRCNKCYHKGITFKPFEKGNQFGKLGKRIDKINIRCKKCGKEFKDYESKRKIYCSLECSNKSQIKTKEALEKRSRTIIERGSLRGDKNGAWKGGISTENHRLRTCHELREWRKSVFQRDNYECCCCLKKGYIHAHHIYPIKECVEKNKKEWIFDITNGQTLCQDCHKDIHRGLK